MSGAFRPAAEAAVSVFDHGLLYGDGVFEGIRAYNGRVFKLERHIDRLFDSAKAIRLEIPHSHAEVCGIVVETCRQNEITTATSASSSRAVRATSASTRASAARAGADRDRAAVDDVRGGGERAFAIVTSTFRRNAPDATSPSIKSLNYLNNILARIEANDRGADEALMLDGQGYVAEATVDNFFIVTDHALLTPPTATNLKGITRETLLALAASLGIRAEEKPFTLFDVWTAKEAFICGTGAEVVPVRVGGRARRSATATIGPVTGRIVAAYHDQLVRSQGTPIQSGGAGARGRRRLSRLTDRPVWNAEPAENAGRKMLCGLCGVA